MRSRATIGVTTTLLVAVLSIPAAGRAQSHTEVWAGLSVGLFDGVGIGLTRDYGLHDYGLYDDDRGWRRGDYRYGGRGRGYADYCWDRSWDLRWGRGYRGWDGYGYPTYDHLDFYHDCLSGGIGYARSRWRSHLRSAYWPRPWRQVVVRVYVTDPFWRPWGPYWAYDPWGWYWDGFRDGRRSRGWAVGRRGWGYDGVVWGAGVRTAWSDGRGVSRPSPLAAPRFKEDPTGRRTAVPRAGSAVAAGAAGVGSGEPAARIRPSSGRGSAVDGSRVGRPGAEGPGAAARGPAARVPAAAPDGSRAPRSRPTDGLRGTAPRERAPGVRGGGVAGDAPTPRAAPRSRPSDSAGGSGSVGTRARAPGSADATPRRGGAEDARPSDAPRAEPRARGASPSPERVRERPSAAPRADDRDRGGRAAPAPRVRSGEREAPRARSDGGERSAPSDRSGGPDRGGSATPRTRTAQPR